MPMSKEQARDEARGFLDRNFTQVNVLILGIVESTAKFFDGFLSQKKTSEKLWGMVTQALEEHYGTGGSKLFVAINDSGLRVEVHGSLDFIDLTKDPHIDIYLLLGTTDEKKAPEKKDKKVEQHPADRAAGALMKKEGGPLGHH